MFLAVNFFGRSACSMIFAGYLVLLLLAPEVGGNTHLRNIDKRTTRRRIAEDSTINPHLMQRTLSSKADAYNRIFRVRQKIVRIYFRACNCIRAVGGFAVLLFN
jgi:hypothetical protein